MILRGQKGGGSSSAPTRTPDSLRSEDTLEVILGLGEGEWEGLVNGGQSFYLGDTPLLNTEGQLNFGDFELLFFPGSGVSEKIRPTLGGLSNSTNVGLTMLNETAVTRTGQSTQINFIEVRIVVQQLFKQTEDGDLLDNTLQFELEYKPSSSATWLPAFPSSGTPGVPPIVGVPGQNFSRYSGADLEAFTPTSAVNPFDAVPKLHWSATAPSFTLTDMVWFDSSGSLIVVKQWNGSAWVTLSTQAVASTPWSFTYGGKTVQVILGEAGRSTSGVASSSTVWLSSIHNKPFLWRGSAWVEPGITLTASGGSGTGELVTIRGKTSSAYVKELRFPVSPIDDTYDIRIKKLSKDPGQDGDLENFIVMQWESFQEVIATDVEFPNTTCVQLVGKASGQFSGVPEFWGIYKGQKVNVPSNYNPVTRLYSGVWDGTWVRAYTNNPAFIWNDIQVNDRYGRSAYYPVTPNKWDVYEAGQYCDELVPNGEGGWQPRWTFNQYITDAQGVKELSRYVAGTFTGVYSDDGEGGVALRVDKDQNAVAIFTQENVVEGDFQYSFSDISTRFNDITVSWVNPDLLYNEDRVRVKNDAHMAKYGRIATDIVAFGCRNRQEAFRRGRASLITATSEFTTVTFKTNRAAQQLDMYDIILVCDPKLGYGISGRIKSFLNGAKTEWELFEPIYLEVGVNYVFSVQVPNPDYPATSNQAFIIAERSLSPLQPRGLVTTLDLDGGSLVIPDYAVFTVSAPDYVGLPKPFRVLGVSEPEGDVDDVEVVAMEVNRSKWDYIDTGIEADAPSYSSFLTNVVDAPKNLRVVASSRLVNGLPRPTLTLTWDRSANPAIRQYRIQMKRNNGVINDIGLTQWTEWEFVDPPKGDYVFYVAGRTMTGVESLPTAFPYSFVGDAAPVTTPGSLQIEGSADGTTYDVKSPVLVWS